MKMTLYLAIAVTLVLVLSPVTARTAQTDGGQTSGAGEASQGTEAGSAPGDAKAPSVFLPLTTWEFETIVDGQEVVHDFVIQNRGSAPLHIERVKTG